MGVACNGAMPLAAGTLLCLDTARLAQVCFLCELGDLSPELGVRVGAGGLLNFGQILQHATQQGVLEGFGSVFAASRGRRHATRATCAGAPGPLLLLRKFDELN